MMRSVPFPDRRILAPLIRARQGAPTRDRISTCPGHRFVMAFSEREQKALSAVFVQSSERIQLELTGVQIVEFAPGTAPIVSAGLVTVENALLAAKRGSAAGGALSGGAL